jgi:hypothetical protein
MAQSSPKIAHYLTSLAREFGHNGLIASFSWQQGVPTRQENVHDLSQELNKDVRSATIEADLISICGSLTDLQGDILGTRETLAGDLEQIQLELEKMTEKVKQSRKKRQPNQRDFIERLTESAGMKSISFRSINHPLFRGMVQFVNSEFSVPG